MGGKLLVDYGSRLRLYEVSLPASSALTAPFESPDLEISDSDNLVMVGEKPLDVSRPEVQALRKPVGDFKGKRIHVVHFVGGDATNEWTEIVLKTGVEEISGSRLCYGDAASLRRLQELAKERKFIDWECEYRTEWKILPDLKKRLASARPGDTALVWIQLIADPEANPQTEKLISDLAVRGPLRRTRIASYVGVKVEIRLSGVSRLAEQPDLLDMDVTSPFVTFGERDDRIISGNPVVNGACTEPAPGSYLTWLASKGFLPGQFAFDRVDISDHGVDDGTTQPDHPNLFYQGNFNNLSRVIYQRLIEGPGNPSNNKSLFGCNAHGTMVAHVLAGYNDQPGAGTIHADAQGFHYGHGVCPWCRIGISVTLAPHETGADPVETQARAFNNGARISNNSYGQEDAFGKYDFDALVFDALARDAQQPDSPFPAAGNQEMLLVFAAGNSGPSLYTMGSPGTAKNVLTVGAAESVQLFGSPDQCGTPDTRADNANDVWVNSSRGPTFDGRKKPDIVAPGTHISGGAPQGPTRPWYGSALQCWVNQVDPKEGSGLCFVLCTLCWVPDPPIPRAHHREHHKKQT